MKTRTPTPRAFLALLLCLGFLSAVRAVAQNFTNLYSFTGLQAQIGPFGGLVYSNSVFYGATDLGGNYGAGTVFSYTPGTGLMNLFTFAGGFTNAAGDFTNIDGAAPSTSLLLSGNTLYGTTLLGGLSGFGTIFSLKTDGSGFASLYTFTNGADGAKPFASLILVGGTLYGTASAGGVNGNGTVFSLHTDGTQFTALHQFAVGSTNASGLFTNFDGFFPVSAVTYVDGTLYGTASGGGATGNGTVFSMSSSGSDFKIVHAFTADPSPTFANGDGAVPEGALALSGNGILYGTTFQGGAFGNGTVYSINIASQAFTSLHSFATGNVNSSGTFTNSEGAGVSAGVILVGNTLYGTTGFGGIGNGTVFALNTNGAGLTPLYSFSPTNVLYGTNLDGAAPNASLQAVGGALYGTTPYGGAAGDGTLFSLNEVSETLAATPTTGVIATGINFTSGSADNYGDSIKGWNWTFGDGGTSSAQNPTHVYTVAGAYTTSLAVTNSKGLVIVESGPTVTLTAPSTTMAFTATPVSGMLPLTVNFTAPSFDSSGNTIKQWNWAFGDGGTSTLQNPSHTYTTPGTFTPAVSGSNNLGGIVSGFGPAAITATNLIAYLGLVENGGFETGDFTGWTISGLPANNINDFVDTGSGSEILPHTGAYLAAFGPTGSLSYLSQTLATSPGSAYNLSFWLNSPDGLGPNEFSVSWNGSTLFDQTSLPALGWTNLTFSVIATNTSTVLQFGFRDDPSFLGLDDVSVLPTAPFTIGGLALSGTNLVLNGLGGVSGGTYLVLTTTNLALPLNQWTPLSTNVLSSGGNFSLTITNGVNPALPQQFFILQTQ